MPVFDERDDQNNLLVVASKSGASLVMCHILDNYNPSNSQSIVAVDSAGYSYGSVHGGAAQL